MSLSQNPKGAVRQTPRGDQASELVLLDTLLSTRSDQAWNAFYRRYERLIIGCIRKVLDRYHVCYTTEDIEDMVNNVCLQLVRDDFSKLRRYDRDRGYRLSSWVGLLATNATRDALRRREPDTFSIDEEATVLQQPSNEISLVDRVALREKEATLNKAAQQLSPAEQLFLHYFYNEHRPSNEIAELLNISINTVYSRKSKVREALRQIIVEMAEFPEMSQTQAA